MSVKTFITSSLAIIGLASAQSSVISAFIPDTDPQPLVASIMGNDAAATTYFLTCPAGTDGSDCGMGPGMTLISGPKTAGWMVQVPEEDLYGSIRCSMGGTTTAICTSSMGGSGANFPGVSTETLDASDISLLPVTVTAGSTTPVAASASATVAASGSGATSAAPTGASQASSPEPSASRTSSGSSVSASSTKESGTSTSATSTGAAASLLSADAQMVMGLAAVAAGVVAVM
ncbi:GPI anchored protein, putative [Paecilomyces variotii No. 5]|uniref:GPI anchored protein, putative n=1 Tax=Byssochlamys spectabilis (strain No. 5 / NBRC 109023) TaxID=1356009 RepID=V5HZ78_BYSSN|nr:GPI anchored protein, putative [Paecilomyces variotii No. 5]